MAMMSEPEADSTKAKDEAASSSPLTAAETSNQTNGDFQPHSWEDIKQTIADNRLEVFHRWPSDFKRYSDWAGSIRAQYGSVTNYVMTERLRWTLSSATTPQSGPLFDCDSPVPFQSEHDFKTLPNDWPYALEPGITHLIVWLKNRLEPEPVKGDMTPKSRAQVEEFVQDTFVKPVKDLPGHDEKILWFKNWAALQSVPGMDHIHIMVRDVPEDMILKWTEGEKIVH